MKLEVFSDKKNDEPIMRLLLNQAKYSEDVNLIAVDENGASEQWLLSIRKNGSISRMRLSQSFIDKYNLDTDCDMLSVD